MELFVEHFVEDTDQSQVKDSYLEFPTIEELREYRSNAFETKASRVFDQQQEHERFGGQKVQQSVPKARKRVKDFKGSLKDDISALSAEERMFIHQQMMNQGWIQGQTVYLRMDAGLIQIRRTSLLVDQAFGTTRGDKMIPVRTVQAVQFKAATALVSGFIEFVVAGDKSISDSIDFRVIGSMDKYFTQLFGRRFARLSHENMVTFGKEQEPRFRELYELILKAIGGTDQPQMAAENSGTGSRSVSDELLRLAHLRDQGFLSESEFTTAKNKILGI